MILNIMPINMDYEKKTSSVCTTRLVHDAISKENSFPHHMKV